jgi:hypothetical protein
VGVESAEQTISWTALTLLTPYAEQFKPTELGQERS